MLRKVLGRTLLTALAVFFVCSFSFFLIHIVPGDPVDLILGDQASALDRENLRKNLKLDQALSLQFKDFILNLLKGDLSSSLYSGEPVATALKRALPATLELAFFALLFSALWGLSGGVFSALGKGPLVAGLSGFSILAMSVPVFVMAPFLIRLFALKLSWFPVSERGEGFSYIVLPALSLALPLGAVLLKMSRASLLEVMEKDYIRTARAKGLSFKGAGIRHGLKNSAVPVITVLGLQAGALLTGTVIVESIFDWPGLGLLLLSAIQQRDYPVVQGALLFIALIYVLVNLAVDLIYLLVHPQMRT